MADAPARGSGGARFLPPPENHKGVARPCQKTRRGSPQSLPGQRLADRAVDQPHQAAESNQLDRHRLAPFPGRGTAGTKDPRRRWAARQGQSPTSAASGIAEMAVALRAAPTNRGKHVTRRDRGASEDTTRASSTLTDNGVERTLLAQDRAVPRRFAANGPERFRHQSR